MEYCQIEFYTLQKAVLCQLARISVNHEISEIHGIWPCLAGGLYGITICWLRGYVVWVSSAKVASQPFPVFKV